VPAWSLGVAKDSEANTRLRAAPVECQVAFHRPGQPDERVDYGRFQVTQVERDRHVFRVPSLRNVALTDARR